MFADAGSNGVDRRGGTDIGHANRLANKLDLSRMFDRGDL